MILAAAFKRKPAQSSCNFKHPLTAAAFLFLFFLSASSFAQTGNVVQFDASGRFGEPAPALYDSGTSISPAGRVLKVNSRYLTLDSKPWLPVMGEFHFSRYPASQWEEEILKMKASGVNVVATYLIWIHHEEIEGQFDWKGQRDLRAFAQICAKHDMYLLPRIGPWAHGEARNGGFPDWLSKKGPTRVNDPVYLSYVRIWYAQIGQQLKGLLWKDGGPVIGIQLENEYSQRGPGAGEEHILELKKIAIESGFDVPLYLVTGWDNAAVPPRAVIPVFGGYPDAPWDSSTSKLPPSEVYAFRFQSRVSANMGAIGASAETHAEPIAQNPLPSLTAEIGGGIEDTYHRRPVIHPDDIAAMFPVMLGSGVNLYGTYMFQGGENPTGKRTTMQESQATGYPNDVPIKSYDFQAPLGEFGEERASFRKLKVFQYFLNDFGDVLAPMTVHAPLKLPTGPEDFSVLRASVRSRDNAGFIFVNNYVRGYATPVRTKAQFQVRLPSGVLQVPSRPLDIPSGAYFIWPFNLSIGSLTLRYSTAQLFARIQNGNTTTLYFAAIPGIPVEFAFNPRDIPALTASGLEISTVDDTALFTAIKPGAEASIDILSRDGKKIHLVVLTPQEAEDAWKVRMTDGDHLLITHDDFFADPNAPSPKISLRLRGDTHFSFILTPPPTSTMHASLPLTQTAANASGVGFSATAEERKPELKFNQIQSAGIAAPVTIGPAQSWRPHGVAQAPPESDLPEAAKWAITLPAGAMDGLSDLFLEVKYQGDVARLYAGSDLLTDNFYNGQAWSLGLRRFLGTNAANPLTLSILPLRQDAPVYFELPEPPTFSSNGQIDRLEDLRLVPEYQLVLSEATH
jgi:beta-galactosidase